MKRFLKENFIVFSYMLAASVLEFAGAAVTSGKWYIRNPALPLGMLLLFSAVMFAVTDNRKRYVLGNVLIGIQGSLNIIFVVIFEVTGTVFDFGMLNLRNDAMNIFESVPVNFAYVSTFGIVYAAFIVFGKRYIRHVPQPRFTVKKAVLSGSAAVLALAVCVTAIYVHNNGAVSTVEDKLYRSAESDYSEMGITANLVSELCRGAFFLDAGDIYDPDAIYNFIYDDVYYSKFPENAGKNYNVITVLTESFEWFSFVQDLESYPNGHDLDDPSVLRELYPNLYRFYDESIDMVNFYSREKTDISENLSILGSYPTDVYINYDMPLNTYATSMPNSLNALDDTVCNSYHNGQYKFYNRCEEHLSLGFESFTSMESMFEMGMTDWFEKGERNLDSEMIEACKEKMFPTDKRFYTYITSITMHGMYLYRESLAQKGYYDRLENAGIRLGVSDDSDEFVNYCAAVMEFDAAVGVMYDYLEQNGLLENTVIAIFGDHNSYYNGLTNYVKGIMNTDDDNYTNLYRVPLMIRCPGVGHRVITKFACTADIVPTLYDLLGINFYSNLYFGNSVFSDQTSVLYSRAYDVFITDKLYFTSINSIEYRSDDADDSYIDEVEKSAKLLMKKLSFTNQICYNDYFAGEDDGESRAGIYYKKLREIN